MNIDSMVRETLHSYADGAPPSAGLLGVARARARRRRVRHAGVAVVVGAAAGLLAMSIPYGGLLGGSTAPGSGPPPVPLAEPAFELPSFPFTPGWVPDGVEPPHVSYYKFEVWEDRVEEGSEVRLGRSLPDLRLAHEAAPAGLLPLLEVEIYASDPSEYFESDDGDPITVQGRPGTRYVAEEGNVFIVWQQAPDQWVRVWADTSIAAADVERYAQELEATSLPATPPFEFGLLPVGMDLYRLDTDRMSFNSEDGAMVGVDLSWDEQAVGPILTSPTPTDEPSMDPSPSSSPDPGPSSSPDPGPSGGPGVQPSSSPPSTTSIEVGGRPAELTQWAEGTSVAIHLDRDWVLWVEGTLNPDDLLAVAEGIELTPAARPFGVPLRPGD
jgi:hypothetical protein